MEIRIATERLKMAPWSEEHAEAFFELTRDDGFNAYPITVYRQASVDAARNWIRDERSRLGKLAIWERKSGALVGMGGLTPWKWEGEDLVDLTYRFRQSAWGKGYGTEAAHALLEYGREVLQLRNLSATITPDNLASKKIAARLGLVVERRILLKGVETDLFRLPNPTESIGVLKK
jgi:[ribosomal protein S5]-alanine N-acetyltransferase